MKKSLIPKKNLVEGESYWCMYNNFSVLHLMKYSACGMFEGANISASRQDIRVMFEGCEGSNKSIIPKSRLVATRHYWCKRGDEDELSLMRFEENGSFYSRVLDLFLPPRNIQVLFEDNEH